MCGHRHGQIDDFLHHRLEPTALGRMPRWRVFAQQRVLADQAQAVVGQHRQTEHGIVGVELARGQTLQVEIGLVLAVELFVRAMIGVQRDHGLVRCGQAGFPSFDTPRWNQQRLTVAVDAPLDHAIDARQCVVRTVNRARDGFVEQRHALTFTQLYPSQISLRLGLFDHLGRAAIGQPLHTGAQNLADQTMTVEARIHSHQNRQCRQLGRALQHPLQRVMRFLDNLLTMVGIDRAARAALRLRAG